MSPFRLFLVFVSIGIPLACGGPEVGANGSGNSRNRGGSAGSTGGTDQLGGSAGDFSGLGGDFSGSGGFAGETDAEPSDAGEAFDSGAVTDGAEDAAAGDAAFDAREASADARSDATANDASTLSACTAQPQNDYQCTNNNRPPHRYTCPISVS